MKPRQPQSWNDTLREVQTSLAGQEAMYGDLRALKGMRQLGVQAIAPKRQRAPSLVPSEHQEQTRVIGWWRFACKGYGLPEFSLWAVPNGGARDLVTAGRLKAEGVRAGVPDLTLAVGRHCCNGLLIELKRVDKYATPEQKEVGAYLLSAGYQWKVCRGADAAIATIKGYLA